MTVTDQGWATRAACKGRGDAMFPATEGELAAAMAVCAGCPVLAECRAESMARHPSAGVWAGVNWGGRVRRSKTRGSRATNHTAGQRAVPGGLAPIVELCPGSGRPADYIPTGGTVRTVCPGCDRRMPVNWVSGRFRRHGRRAG